MPFPLPLSTLFLALSAFVSIPLIGQTKADLLSRLGYAPGSKLLILHADDLALSHSENAASFLCLEQSYISSASVMVPCPWLPEVAEWARAHPGHDLGLHLTLTSEWLNYRWGPVAPKDKVPSLLDQNGYLFKTCEELAASAQPEEVELELRSQIEQARSMGLQPTHLDSHMGCLFFQAPWLFEIYLKLSREYRIPALISRDFLEGMRPELRQYLSEDDLVVDRTFTASPEDYQAGMEQYYRKVLEGLQPGVNVMLIHLAHDDREMQGMTANYPAYPNWCAPWRQADLDFFTSPSCRQLLKEHNIRLVTWQELGKLLKE